MNPVTGPTYGELYRTPLDIVYRYRWKQARPHNLPLPYQFRSHFVKVPSSWSYIQTWNVSGGVSDWKPYSYDGTYGDAGASFISSQRISTMNRALASFSKKQGEQAELLTSLVEVQSSISMLTSRLSQLALFASAVARRDIPTALKAVQRSIGYKSPPKERRRREYLRDLRSYPAKYWKSKSVSSLWLETWMGWLPTIGDIQNSVEVLSRQDFSVKVIRSGANLRYSTTFGSGTHKGFTFARLGGTLRITNPEFELAGRLGLTNPLLTAVQVIPFSWMANWFINLEQFFGQYRMYPGSVVENPYYTEGIFDVCENFWDVPWSTQKYGKAESFHLIRTVGQHPNVELEFKLPRGLSLSRAATLSSLLVQKLLK